MTLGDYSNTVMTGDAEAGETDTGITVASVLTAMNEIFQQILRSLLLWLLDEEHKPKRVLGTISIIHISHLSLLSTRYY